MRPVFQCDVKGCQYISLKEEEMTNVEFAAYDEENGVFYPKKMLLCDEHLKEFEKISGTSHQQTNEEVKENTTKEKTDEEIVQKKEIGKNVKKDLKKEEKRDNIYTTRTDVRESNNEAITLGSEDDIQQYSPFYNVHEFHLLKNGERLPGGKYRITIAPLKVEKESSGIEIVALIEKPDGTEVLSSPLEERKTVQYLDEINNIKITCRGRWENGFFRSVIYANSNMDRDIVIEMEDEKIKSYHPEEYDELYYDNHYQASLNDCGLKVYIIPIMQKNYLNSLTKLLVVTETEFQRNALADSGESGIVDFTYDDKRYKISGSWQGKGCRKEFCADVSWH